MSSFEETNQEIIRINQILDKSECKNTNELPHWKRFMCNFSLAKAFVDNRVSYFDNAIRDYELAKSEINERNPFLPELFNVLNSQLQSLKKALDDTNYHISAPSFK